MKVKSLEIVHSLPGRIRFKAANIFRNSDAAITVQSTFKKVPGVLEAEANATTGSILVHYDPKIIITPDSQRALACLFTCLAPGTDPAQLLEQLQKTAKHVYASGPSSLVVAISNFFHDVNQQVGKVFGGIDLRVILPVALFILGIRKLWIKKGPFPEWYDLVWFSLATFYLLNLPKTKNKEQKAVSTTLTEGTVECLEEAAECLVALEGEI